ncbi:branched-chain amino acid ABC transporter permease [Haloarchaeobius sp. TZWWS8]|uniref:branched-chain amino acid ABC transporter permease n=1 Tax=Haloarchaeobius sp. TZWWS8 TaxID=3446121 RepID=UPI003EBA2ED8
MALPFVQELIFGVVTGSYIAIGAIGFTMVYGLVNMINFAHGEYMTVGAYLGFVAAESLGLPVTLALVPVMLVSGLAGWLLAWLVFEPLSDTGPIPLLLTSIGLGLIMRNGIRLVASPEKRYVDLNAPTYRFEDLGFFITGQHLLLIGVTAVAVVGVHLFLTRTKMGKAMRAMSDNEALAKVTGIQTRRMRAIVWILASAFAGLAGYMLAIGQGATPHTGFSQLLLVITAAILGGAGSVYGAVVGAYVLGITVSLAIALLPSWASELGTTMAFVMLVLVLLVRPGGITGEEVSA